MVAIKTDGNLTKSMIKNPEFNLLEPGHYDSNNRTLKKGLIQKLTAHGYSPKMLRNIGINKSIDFENLLTYHDMHHHHQQFFHFLICVVFHTQNPLDSLLKN